MAMLTFPTRSQVALIASLSVSVSAILVWRRFYRKDDQPKEDCHQSLLPHDCEEMDADQDELDPEELETRRQFIKRMAITSWNAYCKYAWGQDTLAAASRESFNFLYGPCSGHSLVTAMSTLWVMGLEADFDKAKRWLVNRFELNKMNQQWDVRETIQEYIGSMIACYALSRDEWFLTKAQEIADMLEPAYLTTTGIPYRSVNPKRGVAKLSPTTYLSDACSSLLEYPLLSELTGNRKYSTRSTAILKLFASKFTTKYENAPFLKHVNIETGDWAMGNEERHSLGGFHSSLSKWCRDLPLGLLKSYIRGGCTEPELFELYIRVMDNAELNGLFGVAYPSLMIYPRTYNSYTATHEPYTEYTSCYLGAMLALGATQMRPDDYEEEFDLMEQHCRLARQCTETFHTASVRTETGLPPWRFYFDAKDEATNSMKQFQGFYLGPELAETYFIMYRLTRAPKYRTYAYELAQAIHTHCHVSGSGYAEIDSVNAPLTSERHNQPAHFLGATLKYLYLTFCDESVLPLDQWVFNSAGQPLPVRGTAAAQRPVKRGWKMPSSCVII